MSQVANPALCDPLLSAHATHPQLFSNVGLIVDSFNEPAFRSLSLRKRFRKVNQLLCDLIRMAKSPAFLLGAVVDYMGRVNRSKTLKETYTLASFEFWLNHFSELSSKENLEIRAKIAGKAIPRGDYQAFFPIGMDRTFSGTHFVAAHLSPDVDTMIASFWGWLDAFAARVGTGLHTWCLPGGAPEGAVTALMCEMFGEDFFTCVARTTPTLTLTAMDLVTQQNFVKEHGGVLIGTIEHGITHQAIVLVNEQGHYLGDWHSVDAEPVRQILVLYKSCLRWFENNLHTKLISLFAKPSLSVGDLPAFLASVFDIKVLDCEPALEFNEKQKCNLNTFFEVVLGVENGLSGTFGNVNTALAKSSVPEMLQFEQAVRSLDKSDLFNDNGQLKEGSRPEIFQQLQQLINRLDLATKKARNYVERLDVVVAIKHKVLGLPLLYVTLHSDVEEIRLKMENHDFLTVIFHEEDGSLFPVGVVRAVDMLRGSLGTVTLRDFCNLEEVKMASYLEVISVVDHHKSSLKTNSVPFALIGDAQSCNVLIAEQEFRINDKYSLGGMSAPEIQAQIAALPPGDGAQTETRLLRHLLLRRMASLQANSGFYIHPQREFNEYLCFLQAILDDTDLLTKVSNRDVDCVIQLLNRLKSLSLQREVEIVALDSVPQDKNFAKAAAKIILRQPDMYSLYKKIYGFREQDVETNLQRIVSGQPSSFFADTKEQNGISRISQTKMFASNFPYYQKNAWIIRDQWQAKALEVYTDHPEIDLHLHMISTIASADEVYTNQVGPYAHQDELWFWIPSTQHSRDHLATFLAGFHTAIQGAKEGMTLELFSGPNATDLQDLFYQNFMRIPYVKAAQGENALPVAILRFKAGSLNSRKSMITPFLPRSYT